VNGDFLGNYANLSNFWIVFKVVDQLVRVVKLLRRLVELLVRLAKLFKQFGANLDDFSNLTHSSKTPRSHSISPKQSKPQPKSLHFQVCFSTAPKLHSPKTSRPLFLFLFCLRSLTAHSIYSKTASYCGNNSKMYVNQSLVRVINSNPIASSTAKFHLVSA
jgi:hypothetical protein